MNRPARAFAIAGLALSLGGCRLPFELEFAKESVAAYFSADTIGGFFSDGGNVIASVAALILGALTFMAVFRGAKAEKRYVMGSIVGLFAAVVTTGLLFTYFAVAGRSIWALYKAWTASGIKVSALALPGVFG